MIVCVGLATRDTIYKLPRYPGPDERVVATDRVVAGGGPSATAAVAIARLGGDVRFVGAVDELEDVEVIRVPGRPVESTILVTDDARAIVTEDPEPFDIPRGALDGASWIHVDHVGWASLARGTDSVPLSVDAGNPIDGLDPATVDLYGPTERSFDGRRGKLTVVTLGAGGCRAYTDDETIDVPAFEGVDVVSTLGAGDVFHGALLACLDRGLELREGLRHANACAALSCRALDGRSAIPTWDELEAAVA